MWKSLFVLRGDLSKTQNIVLGVIGFLLVICVWWLMAEAFSQKRAIVEGFTDRLPSTLFQDSLSENRVNLDSIIRADSIKLANATEFEKVYPILPTPYQVAQSFPVLYSKDRVVYHSLLSVWRNIQGYLWAILISIPIGFLTGLFPIFRGLFSKQIDALRYLPLTALTGLFIIWFGIEDQMKIAFLAFGIIVYLLPVVVQRINEVESVYVKTVFTLGANKWQTIKSVYIPAVMTKLMDDIRVLTAISWTYIIIAELLNRDGGIGSLMYLKSKQGQIEKVFAMLIIIILIGFIQDRIFVYMDKRMFPHKTGTMHMPGIRESQFGISAIIIALLLAVIIGIFTSGTLLTTIIPLFIVTALLIVGYGEWKVYKQAKLNG